MYITPKTEPVLLLSNGWGQYRAQEIYRLISVNRHWGIVLTDETRQSLIDGPDCEHHWDSYDLLLQYAVYTDEFGLYHRLHDTEGDIWLIPQGFSPEEW